MRNAGNESSQRRHSLRLNEPRASSLEIGKTSFEITSSRLHFFLQDVVLSAFAIHEDPVSFLDATFRGHVAVHLDNKRGSSESGMATTFSGEARSVLEVTSSTLTGCPDTSARWTRQFPFSQVPELEMRMAHSQVRPCSEITLSEPGKPGVLSVGVKKTQVNVDDAGGVQCAVDHALDICDGSVIADVLQPRKLK